MRHHHHLFLSRARRGSVMIIVIWTIAVAAIIVASLQLFAYRQATIGREALERIQARWAARAGLENTISAMARMTQKPDKDDAKSLTREMYNVSQGTLIDASYNIVHHVDGRNLGGPADEHSKFNLNNTNDRGLLMAFDDMALDVLDAIGDWVDKDDDPSTLGVERDYYLSLQSPYEPRNGPLRTLGEIELIAGIWPKYFRGEDWNLDGRLDPNEDDGNRSFPPDEPDGMLDAGWSGHLTVYSVAGGATDSGEPRLWLKKADPKDIVERCGVSAAQAQAIKTTYGNNDTAQLTDLLYTPLQSNATSNPQQQQQQQGQQRPQGQQGQSQNQNQNAAQSVALTDDQIRSVLAECSVTNPKIRNPGKMNLNTVPEKFLRDLFQLLNLDDAVADEVLYLRDKPEGMLSLTDLKKIPGITPQDLRNIAQRFDVASNVFTVACRGRSAATGVEVEIVAVVDRSTIPVRILEYREQ